MSLRDELLGAVVEPRGYTLFTPPDWSRFPITAKGKQELQDLVSGSLKQHGRPDIAALARHTLQQRWRALEQQRAFAIYLPTTPTIEGATPMSIVAVPWNAKGDFEADVRSRADAEVGNATTRWWTVYRWERDVVDEDQQHSRRISYVFPFPGDAPRRGVHIMTGILHPGVEAGGEALTGFTLLADSIAETFRWT